MLQNTTLGLNFVRSRFRLKSLLFHVSKLQERRRGVFDVLRVLETKSLNNPMANNKTSEDIFEDDHEWDNLLIDSKFEVTIIYFFLKFTGMVLFFLKCFMLFFLFFINRFGLKRRKICFNALVSCLSSLEFYVGIFLCFSFLQDCMYT